jgi:predicted CXXCH cytochrome family protein
MAACIIRLLAALAIAAGALTAQPGVCDRCHREIAEKFRRTGMGRSFYKPQKLAPAQTFYHAASDTYFTTIERDGRFYQRRWQKGFDGRDTNIDEKLIDYVMGSGNHVQAFLHRTGRNTLQQLPLGWYAENGGSWAMSPGYDRPDYPGSTRQITYECMFCHNAYPQIPAGHDDPGAPPEFAGPMPLGIDCERCHGPAQRHVETAGRAGATLQQIRASIVNPKRLTADREAEVCMQCHLETTSGTLPHSIRRFDRAPFSYIPGQPLGDFHIAFDRAGGMGDRFEIAHAAYRMRQSQCFLRSGGQSAGKLRCTTCHDPHSIPRGDAATAHYNSICTQCHSAQFQTKVAAGNHTKAPDCISCHMPKRRTDDAVHVAMTDHRILARQPAGLMAEKAERIEPEYRGEVVPYYPPAAASTPAASNPAASNPAASNPADALLYLALAQVLEQSNLKSGLAQLENALGKYRPKQPEFYAGFADALTAQIGPAAALPWYREAASHAPGSAGFLRRLGSAEMQSGQPEQAEATLRRAVAMAPQDAGAWGMLGQVLWQQKRTAASQSAFERALKIDPELPELHGSFGTLLLSTGAADRAEQEFREAVRVQPGNATLRANLASLLASRGQIPEARYEFRQSIRLNGNLAEARLNYARLLASLDETAEAERQAQAAVEANGKLAGAHQLLGALKSMRGDLNTAVHELQTAVELQPDLWRAQFQLGETLARQGDLAAARLHLNLAVQGADPEASASAAEALRRLRP